MSSGKKFQTLRINGVKTELLEALEAQSLAQRPPVSRNSWILFLLEERVAGAVTPDEASADPDLRRKAVIKAPDGPRKRVA